MLRRMRYSSISARVTVYEHINSFRSKKYKKGGYFDHCFATKSKSGKAAGLTGSCPSERSELQDMKLCNIFCLLQENFMQKTDIFTGNTK